MLLRGGRKDCIMEARKLQPTGKSLMIVDDDPSMIDLFRQSMTKRGFEVITATSGPEGIEAFQKCEVPPDLVVSDMTMLAMDGFAFARALYALSPNTPVLIATGHDIDLAHAAATPNVVDLVMKPLQFRALAERVRAILGLEPGGS